MPLIAEQILDGTTAADERGGGTVDQVAGLRAREHPVGGQDIAGLTDVAGDVEGHDLLPVVIRNADTPAPVDEVEFHDTQENTAEAMPAILRELEERGYKIVDMKMNDR